jgi:hypothetical protein
MTTLILTPLPLCFLFVQENKEEKNKQNIEEIAFGQSPRAWSSSL